MLAVVGLRFSWCIAIVMLILGITGSISNIEFGAYLVVKAGDKLARVTSIGQVMVIGACGIGPFLGGSAIQGLGVRGAAILFLFLVLIGAAVAFQIPRMSVEDLADELVDDAVESAAVSGATSSEEVVAPSVEVMEAAGQPGFGRIEPQIFAHSGKSS